MTPDELDRAIEKLPLALVPVGSLEWHGGHLACGCDNLRAEAICAGVAERLAGGVVLPPLYVTAPGYVNWRGSLFFTPALVKQMAGELYRELAKCGFRYALMFLGHAGRMQEECFWEPAQRFMRRSGMKILVSPGCVPEADLGGGHAQGNETGELLASHPEAVHLDRWDPRATRIHKYDGCDPELYVTGLSEGLHEAVREFMARELFQWQDDLARRVDPQTARRRLDAVCDGLAAELRDWMAGGR